MKVMFVFCNEETEPLSFPLGVGVLSSVLKKEGHKVESIYVMVGDRSKINLNRISDQVRGFKPGLICYSATSPAFEHIRVIAKHIRSQFKIKTLCGGVHATLYPREALATEGIDFICVGEGEKPIREFVKRLESQEALTNIPGIWKLDNSGELKKNKADPLQSLDAVPEIDYDAFGRKFINNLVKKNDNWLRYIMNRGCPYSCSYCHNKMIRKTYSEVIGTPESKLNYVRSKNIDLCIAEINKIVNTYDVKVINNMDDLFCMNKKHTLEFCRKFKERVSENVGYSIQTHLLLLDDEIIQALHESRCLRVVVGVESANERLLKLFNRKTPLHIMGKNLALLVKAGFPLGVWTLNILGSPTETRAEMEDTLKFNANHLVDVCKFNFMSPYKDSDIYNYCKERNLLVDGHVADFKDRWTSVIKHNPEESAFLEKFFDIGHWYMNTHEPIGLEDYYLPLIKEVGKIEVGEWEKQKGSFLKKDGELSRFLSIQKRKHYEFMFQGKTSGKVIGLRKFY